MIEGDPLDLEYKEQVMSISKKGAGRTGVINSRSWEKFAIGGRLYVEINQLAWEKETTTEEVVEKLLTFAVSCYERRFKDPY